MSDYIIPAVLKISSEDVENLICSALTGIRFWCSDIKIISGSKPLTITKPKNFEHALTRGWDLELHETGDGDVDKKHRLSLDALLVGIGKAIASGNWTLGHFNGDEQDQHTADTAVQYAIFGDEKYG